MLHRRVFFQLQRGSRSMGSARAPSAAGALFSPIALCQAADPGGRHSTSEVMRRPAPQGHVSVPPDGAWGAEGEPATPVAHRQQADSGEAG
jgi:hypothetical protein